MSQSKNTERCCEHKGADHEAARTRGERLPAGSPCTVPGCGCLGWIPRAGRRGPDARVLRLLAAGVEPTAVAERLGVSVSMVYQARKQGAA